jgi:uncharacterized protein involved in outer membrane biogenesis
MRAIRAIILTILAIPVLLLVGGFGLLVWFTSSDQIRPRLVAAAREAGFDLHLAEPARIAISLWPSVRLAGVRLAEAGREPFLTAGDLSAGLSLPGLIAGRVDIGQVVLEAPVLRLDLMPQGARGGTGRDAAADRPPAAPAGAGGQAQVTLAGLRLRGLQVLSGPDAPLLEIPRLDLAAPDLARPVIVSGEVRALGTAFAFDGEAGPWGEMLAGRLPRSARFGMGAADLSALRPGLRIEGVSLLAEDSARPATIEATGAIGGLPWRIAGSGPAPAALAAGGGGPLRIEGSLGEARLDLTGTVAPERLTAEARLSAPALAPIGAAAGIALPAATRLAAGLRLDMTERGPIRIEALTLSADQFQARADVAVMRGARPRASGEITVERLDLDSLQAAPAGTTPPAAAGRRDRLVPDAPIPLSGLRAAEGDVRFGITALRAGGQDYGPISGRAVLADGRLLVDPLSLGLAGGVVAGRAEAQADGRLALRLAHRGAGLPIARLLPILGLPPGTTRGMLELDLDLAGRGADARALAGSLSGHLGLAMVGGEVDSALLRALGAEIARLFGVQDGGVTPLSCLALRAPLAEGVARIDTLLVETALGTVTGTGQVALGTEQIALRLLPRISVGGINLAAPVLVGGTLAAPRVGLDPQGAGAAVLDALQRRGAGPAAAADCAPALAAARGGRAGPMPAARAPAPQQPSVVPRPQDLLRQLPGLLGR